MPGWHDPGAASARARLEQCDELLLRLLRGEAPRARASGMRDLPVRPDDDEPLRPGCERPARPIVHLVEQERQAEPRRSTVSRACVLRSSSVVCCVRTASSSRFAGSCHSSAACASATYTNAKSARSRNCRNRLSTSPDRRRNGGQVKLPKTRSSGRPRTRSVSATDRRSSACRTATVGSGSPPGASPESGSGRGSRSPCRARCPGGGSRRTRDRPGRRARPPRDLQHRLPSGQHTGRRPEDTRVTDRPPTARGSLSATGSTATSRPSRPRARS